MYVPNKIEMIKKVREIARIGLVEAKNMVEAVLAMGFKEHSAEQMACNVLMLPMFKEYIDMGQDGSAEFYRLWTELQTVFQSKKYWTFVPDVQPDPRFEDGATHTDKVNKLKQVLNRSQLAEMLLEQEAKVSELRDQLSIITDHENVEIRSLRAMIDFIEDKVRNRDEVIEDKEKEILDLQRRFAALDAMHRQQGDMQIELNRENAKLNATITKQDMELRQERQITNQLNAMVQELMQQRADRVWSDVWSETHPDPEF